MSGHMRNAKLKDDALDLILYLGKLATPKQGELHTICFGKSLSLALALALPLTLTLSLSLSLHLEGRELEQLWEFGFLPCCRGKEKEITNDD